MKWFVQKLGLFVIIFSGFLQKQANVLKYVYYKGLQTYLMICELLGKGKLPTLSEALGALENGFVQAGSSGGARELLLKSGGNSCKFPC